VKLAARYTKIGIVITFASFSAPEGMALIGVLGAFDAKFQIATITYPVEDLVL
jgi:hypothetical protein